MVLFFLGGVRGEGGSSVLEFFFKVQDQDDDKKMPQTSGLGDLRGERAVVVPVPPAPPVTTVSTSATEDGTGWVQLGIFALLVAAGTVVGVWAGVEGLR